MKEDEPAPATDALDDQLAQAVAGREAFRLAVLGALDECARARTSELWLCDRDFAHWPLGQPAMVEALTRWIGAKRQLTLVAADYTAFPARFPRWVAWRRQWAHAVRCLAAHEEVAAKLPTMLLAPGLIAVRLQDRERLRGRIYRDAQDIARCRDPLDALLQRTEESFPVTTLGL
jgi:hypothetical protein